MFFISEVILYLQQEGESQPAPDFVAIPIEAAEQCAAIDTVEQHAAIDESVPRQPQVPLLLPVTARRSQLPAPLAVRPVRQPATYTETCFFFV